ncbi:MAG: UDP-N-acetylmuramoyl-tripeptide--D-alanyl-D-alanine ligase [Clostridiales bacterium]|jgi:UDP-N-acetylmuramoyl-tripeptide--D-alanyl-D-alanine ligase|nr:UDP-N-acetylmuramoyl-tripeptide--D-alanyl-D-alanine ligase [Clostridiales bacterium]
MKLEITEIINACGGRLLDENLTAKNAKITSISTDTRTIESGALFVPIVGENSDGHDYISQAAEKGAVCVLTENQNVMADVPHIYVNSTRRALMDLANFYRRMHNVKVVAITGSAGKTTTKDMIADILARKFKTKRTIKNFNNEIGMPLSIFQLEPDDEVLVLEMGMNHANEIHELSLAAAPDIAVITSIGDAHIENFENREGILNAKMEITHGLRMGGTLILNGDDELLNSYFKRNDNNRAFIPNNDSRTFLPSSKDILKSEPHFSETHCTFKWRGEKINLTVPIPGGHMVTNALLACAVGIEMGVSPTEITEAFANFTPPEGRLNISETNGITIINDVYNANPASMIEAIKVLCLKNNHETHEKRKTAILGDMNELGHTAEAHHRATGKFAAEAGVDLLITIGNLARFMYEGFLSSDKNGNAIHFNSLEEFSFTPQKNDIILVKASRGMQFEKIIEGAHQWTFQ